MIVKLVYKTFALPHNWLDTALSQEPYSNPDVNLISKGVQVTVLI